MILQTTLCLAAAAAIINVWLAMRIGQLRQTLKITVGDGGREPIIRRMRAQANFGENVPITLILFGLIEAAGKGGLWLAPLGAVFMIGRIAHAFGMESDTGFRAGRPIGVLTSWLTQLVLVVVGVLVVLGKI
jgi:uncharacterized membrane protein YecN with MAPEG domain